MPIDMVDRTSRDQIFANLTDYMEERIDAFRFDDLLEQLRTRDETLTEIRRALWFHYDDCKNHPIVADRRRWQWFNRLRLFLLTDLELHFEEKNAHESRSLPSFAKSNLVALALLIVHSALLIHYPKEAYLLISIPTAILTWLMILRPKQTEIRFEEISAKEDLRERIFPFVSFGQLLAARRNSPVFKSLPFRLELMDRGIRTPIETKISRIRTMIFLGLIPLIFLLVYSIPTVSKRKQ